MKKTIASFLSSPNFQLNDKLRCEPPLIASTF